MKKPRLEAIEFIRGISMLGVIGIHIGSAYLGQHLTPEAPGNAHLVAGVEDFPFANDKIGPGAPPVYTEKGWLAVTHTVDIDPERGKNGWEDKWTKRYCAAVILLDKDAPWKMIGHSRVPLLAPEADYETKEGFRTNVIFPTAAIPMPDGRLRIYYGAADTVIALAEAKIDDLTAVCLEGGRAE